MGKIQCTTIDSGNTGTDLIYKLQRSKVLEPTWMLGIESPPVDLQQGAQDICRRHPKPSAESTGKRHSHGLRRHLRLRHPQNSQAFQALKVAVIDWASAAMGARCVPVLNLSEPVVSGMMTATAPQNTRHACDLADLAMQLGC